MSPILERPEMPFSTIEYECEAGAAWITLNRPDAMNAITPTMLTEIGEAFDRAEADRTLRCVVLTGAGRAFCAGADLKFVMDAVSRGTGFSGPGSFTDLLLNTLLRLERSPLPVIAAVNGLALAGGLEFVLAADLVVAAETARFGDAHANFGLLPSGGSSVRLPRKIGPTRAKYLMLTGSFASTQEMQQAGLVNVVAPDGGLRDTAAALVRTLAAKSPLGLSRMKRLMDEGLDQPLEAALASEQAVCGLHALSEDVKEGLAAFRTKRKPDFRGA